MMHRGLFSRFEGTSDGIAGDGGAKGVKTFLPFYFFTFLPLKATAGNSERSSDGCEEGDCNLQNSFPGICFHHLYFYF